MAQNYPALPLPDVALRTIIEDYLVEGLEAVRSCFYGASEPAQKTAGQWWADTTSGWLKLYDGSAFVKIAPLAYAASIVLPTVHVGSVSATGSRVVLVRAPQQFTVESLDILSDTATAGSVAATTEWQFALANVTQALQLFSGTVGTGTVLGGVGGGELAVDTPYLLTPDQNATVGQGDMLRFTFTKVGAPTSPLNDVTLQLNGWIGPA